MNPAPTAPLPADYRWDMGMEHGPGVPILERLNSHLHTSALFQHPCGLGPFQEVFLRSCLAPILDDKRVGRKTNSLQFRLLCNIGIFDHRNLPQLS